MNCLFILSALLCCCCFAFKVCFVWFFYGCCLHNVSLCIFLLSSKLKCVSYKQHMVQFLKMQWDNLQLLVGLFNLFTFNIIDMVWFKPAILLFVFHRSYAFLCSFFLISKSLPVWYLSSFNNFKIKHFELFP